MTIAELAGYIKEHKNGNVPYPYGDEFIITHHIRTVLYQHIHITNDHVLECCAKATSYDAFVDLCRPLAKVTLRNSFVRGISPCPKDEHEGGLNNIPIKKHWAVHNMSEVKNPSYLGMLPDNDII